MPKINFTAIDVETANPDLSSICQIGIAEFKNGKLFKSWDSLINPEDYFNDINISIHGIDSDCVIDAPKWREFLNVFYPSINNQIVVSHTSFDQLALNKANKKINLNPFDCTWLDSARVVRRAWPIFSKKGYGLANVANHLNIKFKHHNAKEDARVSGEILIAAINETGLTLEQWLTRITQPIDLENSHRINKDGNPDGPLFGEILVFTGSLLISRKEATDLAAVSGCEVSQGVNKNTSILVVGDQDITKLSGFEKSSKHRKAEDLIKKGQNIKIIGESDFMRLLNILV